MRPGRIVRTRSLRIPAIRAQGEQEEQHAEQVLSLGNPGYRLDIDGLEREERRDHGAAGNVSGSARQHPEQQQHVHDVQREIHQMRPGRIEAEDLHIERVG